MSAVSDRQFWRGARIRPDAQAYHIRRRQAIAPRGGEGRAGEMGLSEWMDTARFWTAHFRAASFTWKLRARLGGRCLHGFAQGRKLLKKNLVF